MKVWRIEQALTEAMDKVRASLKEKGEEDCEGVLLQFIISPDLKVGVDMKLIQAMEIEDVEAVDNGGVLS